MNDGIFTSFDLGIRCYSGLSGPGAGYNIPPPKEVNCKGTQVTCLTQTAINGDGERLYHACGNKPTTGCSGKPGWKPQEIGDTQACFCDEDLCNTPGM